MLSVVVTRDFSDWSTGPALSDAEWLRLRLSRHGSAVRVECADMANSEFQLIRLAYLCPAECVLVGPMCCSPQRAGFEARFRDFSVGAATADALHA
jgi:regulation of enolase protein 1 (concanavalin A-like superfamily)